MNEIYCVDYVHLTKEAGPAECTRAINEARKAFNRQAAENGWQFVSATIIQHSTGGDTPFAPHTAYQTFIFYKGAAEQDV